MTLSGNNTDEYDSSEASFSVAASESTEDDVNDFYQTETNQVCCARSCLTFVLLVVTIAVSCTAFYTVKAHEDRTFLRSWEGDSEIAKKSFILGLEVQLRTASDMSVSVTSYAALNDMQWPYATAFDMARYGAALRSISSALHIAVAPVVTAAQRSQWEQYSVRNSGWVERALHAEEGIFDLEDGDHDHGSESVIFDRISQLSLGEDQTPTREISTSEGPYFPVWQSSPIIPEWVNYDVYTTSSSAIDVLLDTKKAVLGRFNTKDDVSSFLIDSYSEHGVNVGLLDGHPVAQLFYPIFDQIALGTTTGDEKVVGLLMMLIYWEAGLTRLDIDGVVAVLFNACREAESYWIADGDASYLGSGDLHDPRFDTFRRDVNITESEFAQQLYLRVGLNSDYCPYSLRVYPSETYYDAYHSTLPIVLCTLITTLCALTAAVLLYYDVMVEKRKKEVMETYALQENMVSSLFPAHIREKLYKGGDPSKGKHHKHDMGDSEGNEHGSGDNPVGTADGIANELLREIDFKGDDLGLKNLERPIADLFQETTVFFMEVVGFDAWSSMRDPGEVFTLLQTIFQCFDGLAKKLGVYKVETVGESYVAVTGVPDPQADHAVRMARFARECLHRFGDLTRSLEVELGPDTGDLACKIGIHSGSVTGGVLKGDKSRFQLFGDTMNTAARMMSTCKPNRIQCSVASCEKLNAGDKGQWLQERDERVQAKGKGEVQTYWILPRARHDTDDDFFDVDENMEFSGGVVDISAQIHQKQRLIDWHVELLSTHLRRIAHRRSQTVVPKHKKKKLPVNFQFKEGSSAVDEVTEVIQLPTLGAGKTGKSELRKKRSYVSDIELDQLVVTQLRDYVTTVASMYRENAFHNFEHATHVTMSTNKLLKRVVTPIDEKGDGVEGQFSHGITSNPLTQFALVYCALIHDVDHMGVSNFQLIKEDAPIARLYKHRSVAEQNSVDISWDLLMDPVYEDLRAAIYESEAELQHFRQLVVNIVLATDIFDKHMKSIRDNRWDKAFQQMYLEEEVAVPADYFGREDVDAVVFEGAHLKATIVMEHLIQASDVSHTMQHFEIFLKWNERLFQEMSRAYELGRSEKDPSILWYEGEIMFFDKYVIPLAKKLADCGVFGVSSDEYLNYAMSNRTLWAAQGDGHVQNFKKNYAAKYAKMTRRVSIGSADDGMY